MTQNPLKHTAHPEPLSIDASLGQRIRRFVRVHKRKLILAANAAVLLGAIAGYGAWRYVDYRLTLRDLRADAYLAMEASDLERAQHLFTRYLASRPDDAGALHALARCQLQRAGRDQAGLLAAVGTLEHTLELDPRNYAAKRSLLETYLRLGYREEAEPVAEDLFRRYPRDPMPFSVLVSFGLDRKQYDAVIERAEAVLSGEIVPEQLRDTALLAKARAFLGKGQTREAMFWVEQCVKVSASNLQAQELYLQLCEKLGRPPEELSRHARRLVEQNPEVSLNHLMLAIACRVASDQASRRGELETAERYAEEAMDILRGLTRRDLTPVELRMLLDELQRGGAREDALALLGEQADRDDAPWVAREYARRALVMGRADEAALRLSALIRGEGLGESDSELVGLAALAEFTSGAAVADEDKSAAVSRAGRYLEALRAREYDPVANAWRHYLADHGVAGIAAPATRDEKIRTLREALSGGSSNPMFYAALGAELLAAGQVAEGQAALLRAAAWAPYWGQPLALLSRSLRQGGQHPQAFRVAAQAVSREPGRPQVQAEFLRAAVENLDRLSPENLSRVAEWADRLGQNPPPGSELDLLACRVALHAARGDEASARQLLADAADTMGKDQPGVLVTLARVSRSAGLGRRAELIDRALRIDPAYLPAVSDRAAALLGSDGRRAALDYFRDQRAHASDPDAPAWALAWVRLLDAADDPRAAAAWRALADDYTDSVAVAEAMAESITVWRDAELVAEVVDRLEALGRGQTDRAVLADIRRTLLLETDPDARARATDRLERLVRAHPATASLSTRYLLGDAMGMAGRFGDELSLMASVIERGQLPADYHVRFSRRLRAVGATDQANRVLTSLAQRPGESRLRDARIAAGNLAEAGELDRALSVLQAVHANAPDAAVGPLLGRLYLRSDQPEQARGVARQLARQDDPHKRLDAAALHRSLGDEQTAESLVQRVRDQAQAKGDAEIESALAGYLLSHGQLDEGLDRLIRAAQLRGDRVGPWNRAVLACLRLGQIDRARDVAAQASEATGLAEHYGVLEAAAPTLEPALGLPDAASVLPLLIEAPYARAAVLDVLEALPALGDADPPARRSAVAAVVAAADRYPDLLPLQTLAVSSLVLADRDEEAIGRIDRTLTVFGDSAALADVGARLMAENNHLEDAIRYASVWRSRQGRSDEADRLLIELLAANGPADEAPKRLERYVREVEADPAARPAITAALGRAMLRAGHTGWVESTLWSWAANDRDGFRAWCQLARWLPSPEAGHAWLERAAQLLPQATQEPDAEPDPRRLLDLYGGRIALAERFEQRDRLRQIHQELSDLDAPQDAEHDVLNLRGTLAISIGRLDEAVAIYRQLYQRFPRSAAAANNLAYALQQTPGGEQEAVRLARFVVARSPDNGEARDTLAMALLKAGHPHEAEVQSRLAVWFSPQNLTVRVNRAHVLAAVAGDARAKAELDRLYPQMPLMTQRSADTLTRLRKLAETVGSDIPRDLALSADDTPADAPAKPPQG